jgi:flagellar basal body-associated protein FliL
LFLISNYTYEDIATVAGKEQLRAAMLSEAQAIMKRNTGSPQIEEIYFTSFVVQ